MQLAPYLQPEGELTKNTLAIAFLSPSSLQSVLLHTVLCGILLTRASDIRGHP